MAKQMSWTNAARQLTPYGKAAVKHLTSLRSWQLKHVARNTGITTSGKKSDTANDLVCALSNIGSHSVYKSVDMGVKNLAVCVVRPNIDGLTRKSSAHFTLHHWERSDILTTGTQGADEEQRTGGDDDPPVSMPGAYSPSNLAPHAARMAYQLKTDHKPSHILIERQRFRSMGGAAVQEWTLRVNSLEAMLWASIETMKQGELRRQTNMKLAQTFFPEVIEMSPARIAAFWNGRGSDWSLEEEGVEQLIPEDSKNPKKQAVELEDRAKRGMEKSEKISLVKNWLQTGSVDVVAPLQSLANAFMQTGRARKVDGDVVVSKKDDLADCVVQGVTWGLVERNRRTLHKYLSSVPEVEGIS
ncbi:mitochondrial resolvase Ydc2 [Elsinoe ampelina]|uniref:Mitochondrial resolvase Ydc2 n=1 Tax=Elsinoe ampelina TaxID=302913 RepID=A0A6A6GCF5_9PEZI|nr:mitochondrial resolvase Ydc2 [Elsinoe ampelina]